MMLLSSCATAKSSIIKVRLPELSVAGAEVGKEFTAVCDGVKCKNIYAWLVKLHDFRIEYDIYKQELMK